MYATATAADSVAVKIPEEITADDDDDQQQRLHGVPDGVGNAPAVVNAGGFHAGLFCADERNDHAAQAHQDAGTYAMNSVVDGDTARDGGVDNEGQTSEGSRQRLGAGNVGGGGVGGVVAVFYRVMQPPMADAAATEQPDSAPNSMLPRMLACAMEPGNC